MYENIDLSSLINNTGNYNTNNLSSLFNPMPAEQQGNFVTGQSLSDLFGSNNTNSFGLDDIGGVQGLSSIVNTLGGLFLGFGQANRAKDALNFQKNAYATNIKNQTQAYNTNLEDRIKARYATENKPVEQAQQYIDKNRL